MRSLVVDYDFNFFDSLNNMLKSIGLRSEWTTSGREAAYRAKSAWEDRKSTSELQSLRRISFGVLWV